MCFRKFSSTSSSIACCIRSLSSSPLPCIFHTTNHFKEAEEEQQGRELEIDPHTVTNRAYWTRKIHKLCAFDHNVDEALRLIDQLRLYGYCPDSLNLSSVIHALCDARRFPEAHRRFFLAVSAHSNVNESTCNVIIARLLDSRSPESTLHVIRALFHEKPEFVPSLMNYNRLMDQFCALSRPRDAHQVFLEMRNKGHCPNVVSYTTLINGYCGVGEIGDAWNLFDEMSERGVSPNAFTYSILIRGVLRKRDIEKGKALIGNLWEVMIGEEDMHVNTAAFSNVIDCLCREGLFHEVFRIAEDMPQGKCVVEEFAYSQMIDSLCRYGRAYQLLEEGIQFGYSPSEFTYNLLIEGLCSVSDLDKAKNVLNIMLNKKVVDRTRIYNIYLRAICLTDNPTELLNTLVTMLQTQCQPDLITLNTVINGFCKMGRVEEALKVLQDMMSGKFCTPDVVTYTTVVGGLLEVGRDEEALHLLRNTMPMNGITLGVVTYNTTLHGLFKMHRADDAMEMFNCMISHGIAADCTTYTIIIDGLFESKRIDEAKRFWDDIVWPSRVHDSYVYSAILKGLCRSGRVEEACDFLYELVDCGVTLCHVNYNIVIDGACRLGLKKEAYQILGEMRKNGLAPDAVTWRVLDKLHRKRGMQFCDSEDLTLQSQEPLVN
nr:pentatricopeptide repeat-containing protein At3g18020 [Ipomoea trifida]